MKKKEKKKQPRISSWKFYATKYSGNTKKMYLKDQRNCL